MNKRNFITGLFVLAFFAVFYFVAGELKSSAAFWPRFVCMIGMMLSAANTVLSGIKWMKDTDQATVFPLTGAQIKRGAILTVMAVAWIFAIPRLGFLVSALLFSCVIALVFEPVKDRKRIIRDVVTTLAFSVLLYLMFSLLGIHFPKGLLI